MCELICPLCNEVIKAGQVRKEWWMSDFDKRIAHTGCITAYEKGIVKGKSVVNEDLEFAYKRSKVLADLLDIPVHESSEVTGTILGLVRGKVERLQETLHKFAYFDEFSKTWTARPQGKSKAINHVPVGA